MPSYAQLVKADPSLGGNGTVVFDGMKNVYGANGESYLAEIFFPLYSSVKHLWIGLQKNAVLAPPRPYRYERPILFYGSSITQGGCASKPGDDYENRLCRMLDTDYINLGFSGSAKGEDAMARYIAAQDPSVFVLDYDHNAPTAEHLKNTHYPLYKTVRDAHPETPIILMTMPTIEGYENRSWHKARRDEILASFERARAEGDENVYLLDAYGVFGEELNGECSTVDGTHPDSLGFLRMAELLYPLLNQLLNGDV